MHLIAGFARFVMSLLLQLVGAKRGTLKLKTINTHNCDVTFESIVTTISLAKFADVEHLRQGYGSVARCATGHWSSF